MFAVGSDPWRRLRPHRADVRATRRRNATGRVPGLVQRQVTPTAGLRPRDLPRRRSARGFAAERGRGDRAPARTAAVRDRATRRRDGVAARAAASQSRLLPDGVCADGWLCAWAAGRDIRAGPRSRLDRAQPRTIRRQPADTPAYALSGRADASLDLNGPHPTSRFPRETVRPSRAPLTAAGTRSY